MSADLTGVVLGDEEEGGERRGRPQTVRDATNHAPSGDQEHISVSSENRDGAAQGGKAPHCLCDQGSGAGQTVTGARV